MSSGKGSRNRLKGTDIKKYESCPLWENMKKDIKETLCGAGQVRNKRCDECVCKGNEK